MSNIRKSMSAFRQLSLTNYDSPSSEQRRKSLKKQFSTEDQKNLQNATSIRRMSLKKQFSEDIADKFLDCKIGAKTSDRPHPIKIAWAEHQDQDGIVAKKCVKEVKRVPKLTRHSSLEKDSILYSKQELADRLKQALKEREGDKRNLNIFLAHNVKDYSGSNEEDCCNEAKVEIEKPVPKIIAPLITPPIISENNNNVFQIRKNRDRDRDRDIQNNNFSNNSNRSNAIVVIPIIENNIHPSSIIPTSDSPLSTSRSSLKEDPKAVNNIIIRPATAAVKREFFKKRTNSAFNSISKEPQERRRPPLVRSSSAPTRPEHVKPKFLATKRKIKASGKKNGSGNKFQVNGVRESNCDKENPRSQKELNRYVPVNGNDVETMVSLISPAASDNEEVEEEKIVKSKGSPVKIQDKKEEKEGGRHVSLRKTVKSVSFQQSSIHAIRSFSASFPGRRSSMATALMLANGSNLKNQNSKLQEKRTTNSNVAEDDDRGPKRRLVRSATEKAQSSSEDDDQTQTPSISSNQEPSNTSEINTKITIDIKDKTEVTETDVDKSEENDEMTKKKSSEETGNDEDDGELKFGSAKEKQCWEMYCKMSEKGLKVSYDTILRGMLTPTEYRMRRKESDLNSPVEGNNAEEISKIDK